ncbi:MAG TPA: cytochrome-c oxidase, cbb3-type subunit II, partial [Kofleriaceae bacterium]|nr:cytochrome-c oxidase, cbb3-type subunit II [Kofleriaceae bacterium]
MPAVFTVLVVVAVVVASLFEIIPTFLIGDNIPKIASVKPYTPLELYGRDIYIKEGCYNCHSQMVRPFIEETVRYGNAGESPTEYSKPGEFVYDHPFQWGSRRIGPDLAREGTKTGRNEYWHLKHMNEPTSMSHGSIMPAYPHMLRDNIDFGSIQSRVNAMAMLNVPYSKEALNDAAGMARAQAAALAANLVKQNGPAGMENKDIIALIAYLQRLGQDIQAGRNQAAAVPAPVAAPAPVVPASVAPAPVTDGSGSAGSA